MQDLIKQEQFELEVLDRLNSARLLKNLILGGGTMLRLCYGLNRFSVDLDFWIVKKISTQKLFKQIKDFLGKEYTLTDSAMKYFTLLFEFKSPGFPRKLKIEIRKERKGVKIEQAIAYSEFSNKQVFLGVISLKDMMRAKIEAFLARKEARDAFDIEFLLKKGIEIEASQKELKEVLSRLNSLNKRDYLVKLGPLLGPRERAYYTSKNFTILQQKIKEKLAQST